LFGTADCSGTPIDVQLPKALAGDGTVESGPYVASTPGTRSWRAVYNGSGIYNSRTAACAPIGYVKATGTISLQLHDPGHVDVGASVAVGTHLHPDVTFSGPLGVANDGSPVIRTYVGASCTGAFTSQGLAGWGSATLDATGVSLPSGSVPEALSY